MSKVSVIILSYNGKSRLGSLLDEAIKSAINQSFSNIEVLFVDNGSSDDSVEYVHEKFGDSVKVIELGRNYGFCLGNNLAVKYISRDSEYILFQNPDAVLSRDYVEGLVNLMMSYRSVGAAQGLQYSYDGSMAYCGGYIDSYGRSVEIVISNRLARLLKKPLDVYWVSGSAMIIHRKLFESIGGFSSEFFMYHDEIDLCSRVRSLGRRCVCDPRVSYRHVRGGIIGRGINWVAWYFANRNRWLTTIRYLPLKYLLKSLLFSAPTEFMANFLKSFKKHERSRMWLQLKIYMYLLRNIKHELNIRSIYSSHKLKDFDRHVVKIPNPFVREAVSEKIALIKALSIERI